MTAQWPDAPESTSATYAALLADRQLTLVLTITFVGMLETALAPALPGITIAFGVSDSHVGLLVTSFKIPSILLIPVAAVGMYFLTSFRLPLAAAFLLAQAIFPATFGLVLAVSDFRTVFALAGPLVLVRLRVRAVLLAGYSSGRRVIVARWPLEPPRSRGRPPRRLRVAVTGR